MQCLIQPGLVEASQHVGNRVQVAGRLAANPALTLPFLDEVRRAEASECRLTTPPAKVRVAHLELPTALPADRARSGRFRSDARDGVHVRVEREFSCHAHRLTEGV